MTQPKDPNSTLTDPERAPATTRDDAVSIAGRPVGAPTTRQPSIGDLPLSSDGADSLGALPRGMVEPLSRPSSPLTSTLPSVGIPEGKALSSTAISPGVQPPLGATLPSAVAMETTSKGPAPNSPSSTLRSAVEMPGDASPKVGAGSIPTQDAPIGATLKIIDVSEEGSELEQTDLQSLRKRFHERDQPPSSGTEPAVAPGVASTAAEDRMVEPTAPAVVAVQARPTGGKARGGALAWGIAVMVMALVVAAWMLL